MMNKLTIKTKNGYALKLNNPQSDEEAKAQLMWQYKIAINKLAELENFAEEIEELISHNYILYGWIPKDVLIKKINKLNEVIKGLENESAND